MVFDNSPVFFAFLHGYFERMQAQLGSACVQLRGVHVKLEGVRVQLEGMCVQLEGERVQLDSIRMQLDSIRVQLSSKRTTLGRLRMLVMGEPRFGQSGPFAAKSTRFLPKGADRRWRLTGWGS